MTVGELKLALDGMSELLEVIVEDDEGGYSKIKKVRPGKVGNGDGTYSDEVVIEVELFDSK